jgi:putative transposase
MRFAFIQRHEGDFGIAAMCRVLSVMRPGYYAWKKRRPSRRAVANEALLVEIRTSHLRSKRTYGSPRVWQELKGRRGHLDEKRVARLMAQDGLRAKRSKRYRVTTDSRKTAVIHENVLGRDFRVGTADRAWVGDITYLWTREGWLYLAVVLDIGTRRVIGWSLQPRLGASLVTSALDMALSVGFT